ncbi:MAG: hypothetical protein EB163_08565 [Nitrososphaeria archaeon]|nr:hypothetical protein [Nitrososphaeria archaeon]NDB52129.1 hypothetical protein [Nitrosopumilaceae archaeon]NDB88937.1 hypothetical protein [Nitrososphaerota archaeon]NDB63357.1 hypothetical protein [Nitrosopumilaceae archaeon]NDB90797.1 hypothetical protein [Nitrososphaerota archaeon]
MNKFWDVIKNNLTTVKHISVIGIADVAGTAISSIFWLYLASIMTADGYGIVHYYIAIANIASTIALMGSENTLRVYLPKGVKIQSTAYAIVFLSSGVTCLVLFLVYSKVEIIILTLSFVISNLAIADTLGRKEFTVYSKFFILQKILLVIFAIVLYYLLGMNGVILGLAISFVPYIYQTIRGFSDSKICFSLIKERLAFFLTSFVHTFTGVARGQVDKLIIAPMLGFELLGNYSFALQVVAILMIFPNIIYKYTVPTDSSGKSTTTVKKVTVLISVIISVMGATLSPIAISTLFPKYVLATQAMQILSFHTIPATIGLMINSKFLGMERNRIVLIGTILSLSINVGGVIVLGPILGIIGTSIAFVLSSTANCIYLIVMNNKMKSDQSASVIS